MKKRFTEEQIIGVAYFRNRPEADVKLIPIDLRPVHINSAMRCRGASRYPGSPTADDRRTPRQDNRRSGGP